MASPELLEDRIEQMKRFATMDEAMAHMPEPTRVNVDGGGIDDHVLHTTFEPSSDMKDAPSDVYILPFGNSIEGKKSPQIILRTWATQAALADARDEEPRRLIVISQNGQGSRSFDLTPEERKKMLTADDSGKFSMRPITDRIDGVVAEYGGEVDTVVGHSLGGELGLTYVLQQYRQATRLMSSGSVRHATRRPITELLMKDFANSSPRFSQQIAETEVPALMDYYHVTPEKLPKMPPGSTKYVLQAVSRANLALRRWLASDGYNEDLEQALTQDPFLQAWVEQGDCKLERPNPEADEAAARVLMATFGGRLLYEFSSYDHGRGDAVPHYARTIFEKTVELINA